MPTSDTGQFANLRAQLFGLVGDHGYNGDHGDHANHISNAFPNWNVSTGSPKMSPSYANRMPLATPTRLFDSIGRGLLGPIEEEDADYEDSESEDSDGESEYSAENDGGKNGGGNNREALGAKNQGPKNDIDDIQNDIIEDGNDDRVMKSKRDKTNSKDKLALESISETATLTPKTPTPATPATFPSETPIVDTSEPPNNDNVGNIVGNTVGTIATPTQTPTQTTSPSTLSNKTPKHLTQRTTTQRSTSKPFSQIKKPGHNTRYRIFRDYIVSRGEYSTAQNKRI
jgi:hypothetical protein